MIAMLHMGLLMAAARGESMALRRKCEIHMSGPGPEPEPGPEQASANCQGGTRRLHFDLLNQCGKGRAAARFALQACRSLRTSRRRVQEAS